MEREQKRNGLFFILIFLTYYGSNALFWEFIVVYFTQAGYKATFAGSIITATYLLNLLVQPAVGIVSDKLGSPRKILLIFAALLAPSAYLLIKSINIPVLLVASMTYLAVFDNPICSLLDSYAVKNQERLGISYGAIRAGGSLGYAVALIAGGSLIYNWGYPAAFHLRFVLLIGMFFFILLQPKDEEESFQQIHHRKVEKTVKTLKNKPGSISALLKNKPYCYVVGIVLIYQIAVRVFSPYSPILVQELGGNEGTIGLIGGLGCFIQIPVMVLAGRKACGKVSTKMYLWAFGLVTARCILIWLFPSLWAMLLGTIMQQAAGALSTATSVQLFYNASPQSLKSTGITVGQALTGSIAMLVGNLLGGLAADYVSPMAIVALSGAFGGIGSIFVMAGERTAARQQGSIVEPIYSKGEREVR